MRETHFVRENRDRWEQFENELRNDAGSDVSTLADLYVGITDDLAYARAKYPWSLTTQYLNDLAAEAHRRLYLNKRGGWVKLRQFWAESVPESFIVLRPYIIVSLVMFATTYLMAYVVTLRDETLARSILSDGYVETTIENIRNGNPMGVYKQMDGSEMFVYIFLNNEVVMGRSILLGLFTVLIPAIVCIYHGFMVGAFHGLFVNYGAGLEFLLGVYIHGAVELSVLVIACAAGLLLGNSLFVPGTYPRGEAFLRAGRVAVRVLAGMTPFIAAAAFLESYVTRFSGMHVGLALIIILSTLAATWWYVWILPQRLLRKD
jgi:uncharacterized membrane protein SpoIIM required for sporulation